MVLFNIKDTKAFMKHILTSGTFDFFRLRSIEINSFAKFEISGLMIKENAGDGEQKEDDFTKWESIRPYAFSIIKGNSLPSSIKIIYSYDRQKMSEEFPLASALFLNIIYNDKNLHCTTGTSQKEFSLDKTLDDSWDSFITDYFKINNIEFE